MTTPWTPPGAEPARPDTCAQHATARCRCRSTRPRRRCSTATPAAVPRPAGPPPSKTMAGWALGLAIFGCSVITWVLGAIFAIQVLVESRQEQRDHGKGMAIAALVFLAGWAVVALFVLTSGALGRLDFEDLDESDPVDSGRVYPSRLRGRRLRRRPDPRGRPRRRRHGRLRSGDVGRLRAAARPGDLPGHGPAGQGLSGSRRAAAAVGRGLRPGVQGVRREGPRPVRARVLGLLPQEAGLGDPGRPSDHLRPRALRGRRRRGRSRTPAGRTGPERTARADDVERCLAHRPRRHPRGTHDHSAGPDATAAEPERPAEPVRHPTSASLHTAAPAAERPGPRRHLPRRHS